MMKIKKFPMRMKYYNKINDFDLYFGLILLKNFDK